MKGDVHEHGRGGKGKKINKYRVVGLAVGDDDFKCCDAKKSRSEKKRDTGRMWHEKKNRTVKKW